MGMSATLMDVLAASGGKARTVIAEPYQPGCMLPQRLGHLPAALGGVFADRRQQQAIGQEQRYDGNRLWQPVHHIRDAWRAGAETCAYLTSTAPGQPRSKINNGLVGRRSRRSDRKE